MKLARVISRLLVCCFALFAVIGCTASKDKSVTASTYSEQSLMIDNGEYKIPGILVLPKNTEHKKLPVMLMLHGTASQKNEVGGLYQRLAVYLADRGIASLRIDFAGTGDSPVDYRQYSLTSATRDVTTALDYLAAKPELDINRMGLVGFSQGGLIAQLVAAQDSRIQTLVAWSSAVTTGQDAGAFNPFFQQYYGEAKANGFAVVKFPWRAEPLNFGLQWFDEIKVNNSLQLIKNYQGKLLAVAGNADAVVPYASSIKLVDAVSSTDAELVIVKGADHLFNVLGQNGLAEDQSVAEEMLTLTTEWVERNL
ncbi:alpha/beta hydrolase family protein [Cellvibrio sp. NN19]|uniref:alpha/beta hydrolase family protein n=1 Tax=Cellvibrio chitinivorans TaxID=3102792 RepID=UPI002B414C9A|nr:alpha/beta fold hydrolase [Cellvibrio sp. NN19]